MRFSGWEMMGQGDAGFWCLDFKPEFPEGPYTLSWLVFHRNTVSMGS